jgi:hypothetical protein
MAVESCSMVSTSMSVIIMPSKAIAGDAGSGESTAIADGIDACQVGGRGGSSSAGALHMLQHDVCL